MAAVRLLGLLVSLLVGTPLAAQQILFRNYSVEDGLRSNTVWCITQDAQGYMWFGTKNGLSRFDGYQFKSYQFDEQAEGSLGNNFIHDICAFDSTTFWVGTEKGVYVFDLKTEQFARFEPTAENLIYALHRDKHGDMWIATRNRGVFHYQRTTGELRNYRAAATALSSNQVRSITEDAAGNIWLGAYGGGLDRLDPLSGEVTHYHTGNSGLLTNHVLTVYADLNDNIWVGTVQGGLSVWQRDTETIRNYTKSGPGTIQDNIVRAIYQPSPNKLYVGTEKGLGVLNLHTGQFTTYDKRLGDDYGISDNAVYAIYPDREGNVWLGTYFGGVDYFQDSGYRFELYYPKANQNSISGSAISCFLEDKPGKFWIGTEDGGLNYYDSATGEFKQYPFSPEQEPLTYHNIHALVKDASGNILIGTFTNGLNVYNPKTGRVKRYRNQPGNPASLSSNIVYSLYRDKEQAVWVGTVSGLNIFDVEADTFIRIRELGLDTTFIYDIYEDNLHNIWFATYNAGLIVKNKRSGKWARYAADGSPDALNSNKLTCLLDDHNGSLWIGTDGGGLNRLTFKDRKITTYGSREGIDANIIYGILADDIGNIWLSTNNGLYSLNLSSGKIRHYADWSSIQGKQFNYKAHYKASDGKLYFGGIKGFNSFYPDSIESSYGRPTVALTNFQLFNQDVDIHDPQGPLSKSINFTDQLTLKFNQSVISFEYAALTYLAPQKTQYAYKMEGFDEDWNYVKNQRKATYTNLPPGDYVFKVKATDDQSDWSTAETRVKLTVKPPFYRTNLAYIAYALVAMGSIAGIRKYYIRQTQKRNEIKLERLKNKREQEFYNQKIEFFTAMAHEIRTPLSLIIAPLEKLLDANDWEPAEQEQLRTMDENSDRLLSLVNQLLDFRRIESDIYQICPEPIELVSFIHAIYSRFSAIPYQKGIKFALSTKVSSLRVQADAEALTKIINNLLINAFKFTRTQVRMNINDPHRDASGQAYFSVSIEDDGIGIPATEVNNIFKKFFKVSEGAHQYTNLGGTGIGLALAKSLTEKHHGQLNVNSEKGKQTTFTVLIPYTGDTSHPHAATGRAATPSAPPESAEGKATILVVEDDVALIEFLAGSLRAEGFHVLAAQQGREGLELLEANTVDLIISDVMMPEIDGLELCRLVKTNINYSHIPLIMLTAKGNSGAEIAGIENGADAYIIKPFKWKHVLAVTKNLLESRDLLREKFAQHPFETVNSLGTNAGDKQFIAQIVAVIETRITDPQLSVEELSREMNMSRSSLHKKVKSLSGRVPNEFIRVVRLKHAAKLLLAAHQSVSEVGYMVGFNSPSYFSKCFAQQFKLTPSEFIDKYTGKDHTGDDMEIPISKQIEP
ncbi:hybrid sensor histidine kinase/response regulator transcription factor [Parapedobacter sp. 10938]|uniref:hybrid sensor histidine kinase/response regulator transcription factor n=1 Tax=Parapedobacter flavus TaxID=3110225 RepID=UPI002DBD59B9|nr:two-component regulator propeller domain-containing protein [Parapedobacter sp. 10938]MEC3880120.1 two-component regulator propeller domain-containing protein [Parapedobacter sp. 10938]